MRTTSLVLLLAGLAVAQTTSTTSSAEVKCAALNIVKTCTKQLQKQYEACAPADEECLCQQAKDWAGCWNNCPDTQPDDGSKTYMSTHCALWSASPKYKTRATVSASWSSSAVSTGASSTATSDSAPSAKTTTANSAIVDRSPASGIGLMAGVLAIVGLFV